MTHLHTRVTMNKFISFDINNGQTVGCAVPASQPDRVRKLPTDVVQFRQWLKTQRGFGNPLHLTFELSALSGHLHDGLVVVVDPLEVSNPTSLTWIHPTARKNDRIDARKQALLRSIIELPRCNIALG